MLSSHCRQLNFPWVSRCLLKHYYRAGEAERGATPLEEPALVVLIVVLVVAGAGQLARAVLAGRADPGGHGRRLRGNSQGMVKLALFLSRVSIQVLVVLGNPKGP